MLRIIQRVVLIAIVFGFVLASNWTTSWIQAGKGWANQPANLTISEYLDLIFELAMARDESDALNTFSIVNFYPSNRPSKAIVVVYQAWHDERVSRENLRREIRKLADAYLRLFKNLSENPKIRKRWFVKDPRSQIIVRHVRESDFKETIAVTMNGTTYFDEKIFIKVKTMVEERGGVWGW